MRVYQEKRRDRVRVHHQKSDGVRVHHEKKNDGGELTMRKGAMG